MPIYQRPVSPFFLSPSTLPLAVSSSGPSFGGQVILNGLELLTSVTVTFMRTGFMAVGATPGTCQMGIYDASAPGLLPGSLMANTATFTAAATISTVPLLSNLPLSAGKYWLAFLDTSSNDTNYGFGGGPGFFFTTVLSNATGLTTLPSVMGAVSDNNVAVAFCALILGGWS